MVQKDQGGNFQLLYALLYTNVYQPDDRLLYMCLFYLLHLCRASRENIQLQYRRSSKKSSDICSIKYLEVMELCMEKKGEGVKDSK